MANRYNVDWSRLSAERLTRLTGVINRHKNECGAERVTRDAIESLGEFRSGAAVLALVGLLDHADEGHRATARTSLLRIRNSMGMFWLDGSLSIIGHNARRDGDRRMFRNALRAMVDCSKPEFFLHRFLPELRGADGEDLRFSVRLAARVSHFDVADRLMDIAFDAARDDVSRMLALESLAGAVRELDEDELEYLELMLAVEMNRLSETHDDGDIDWILDRAEEVFRVIHERIDDIAHDTGIS